MTVSKAIQICHKNKLYIYPRLSFISNGLFHAYIYVSNTPDHENKKQNEHKKIDKRISVNPKAKEREGFKELNNSISKTYVYYAKKC